MGLWQRIKSAGRAFTAMRTKTFRVGLRGALSSGQPGTWATDHAAESGHVKDWMYIAIRAICLQAAKAEVAVYDDSRRETKSLYAGEQQVSRPLANDTRIMRLYKRPNPDQSGALFRYECVMQLQATGTCLIWNVPRKLDGTPCERYVIPTACAYPVPGGWRVDPGAYSFRLRSSDPEGYVQTGTFGQILGKVIPQEQVQVIRWPHPLVKDDGFSPISAGAALVETGEKVTQSRYAQLVNGIDPSLLILLGGDENPDAAELDAAAAKLNEKYAGPGNRRKAMIIPGGGNGASVTPLSQSASDMDFAGGFKDYRDAALALQGTPPVAAGIQEAGAYAAYYASLRQFIDLTVQPILDVLAEEDTEQFLRQFGDGLTCEIEASPINDPEVTERELQNDIAARIRTVDEVRTMRGLTPFGGARGARIAGEPLPQTAMAQPPQRTGFPVPGLSQKTNGYANRVNGNGAARF